jgi:hypothetical protein
MNQTLNLMDMETVSGGNAVDNFCAGFGAVAGVYAVGILANWWNPVGWSAGAIGTVVGAGCGIYAIR